MAKRPTKAERAARREAHLPERFIDRPYDDLPVGVRNLMDRRLPQPEPELPKTAEA